MENAIAELAVAVIAVVAAIISAYVVPFIRSKTSAEDRQQAAFVARTVVDAVEQMSAAGLLDVPKSAYAMEWIEELLNEQGIKVSQSTINSLVEAAVKEMKIVGEELKQ